MNHIQSSVLKTLTYADLFSYPLYSYQIKKLLISPRRLSLAKIKEALFFLVKKKYVVKKNKQNLYALSGRKDLFLLQRKRERLSRKKLFLAKKIIFFLGLIPTVRLIGLSSGLAVNNAKWGDDIDLFIVSAPRSVYLTRLLVIIILEIFNVRRRPDTQHPANKFCANMFVSEDKLSLPFAERDLYSAYEVANMKPIINRGNTYQRFLEKNVWVREFLANSIGRMEKKFSIFNFQFSMMAILLSPLELIAKKIQLWYMKKRITSEKIEEGYLRFHPQDKRQRILPRYNWRIAHLKKTLQKHKDLTNLPALFPIDQ